MAANNNEMLESVYISSPIEGRSSNPLYRSVRELIDQYSVSGNVLDIGCSDGVATYGMPNTSVYGVDVDLGALEAAKKHQPEYNAIQADFRQLPFSREGIAKVDTVLLLDILEHESRTETRAFLKNLHNLLKPDHTLIASMPIISPLSIETWREGLLAVRAKQRPAIGLFDRTHKILTGRRGHIRLFEQAGYSVVEEHQTNHMEAVSGDWKWKQDQGTQSRNDVELWLETQGFSNKSKAVVDFIYKSLGRAYAKTHEGGERSASSDISEALVAYQGLYVLKPSKSSWQMAANLGDIALPQNVEVVERSLENA